jgi:hypothetical protein
MRKQDMKLIQNSINSQIKLLLIIKPQEFINEVPYNQQIDKQN